MDNTGRVRLEFYPNKVVRSKRAYLPWRRKNLIVRERAPGRETGPLTPLLFYGQRNCTPRQRNEVSLVVQTPKGQRQMSDRVNYLTVVLEGDIRADDAEALMSAIRQLRGVISVAPNVAVPEDYMAMSRVRTDLEKRIWKALKE